MAKKQKTQRNIKVQGRKTTMTFKPNSKYKMDKDELENHLHLIRTGHRNHGDKTKYNRKEKHKAKISY